MDQINIWYAERNRMKFSEGVFYGQFNSDEDFLVLKNYAKVRFSFRLLHFNLNPSNLIHVFCLKGH
jgi:hypothetical protein